MSQVIDVPSVRDQQLPVPAQRQALTLRQRGMITIEYAIGAVLVLVLVGVIIASIQQGWFRSMVQDLVMFLVEHIKMALGRG